MPRDFRDFVGISVRSRVWLSWVVAWWCLLAGGVAQAGKVDDLYIAGVPVTRQDPDERSAAIMTALTQVLIKITGEARLEERPEVRELLRSASGFVQQFRYEKKTQASPLPNQPPIEALYLRVQFDPVTVNEALRKRGLPVWGDLRPSTLIWLAVEQGSQRYLVSADSDPEVVTIIREASGRRGIPVLLPLLDLEDQAALSIADVWGNFRASVLRASQRYQPDAILVGRVYRQGNGLWEAAWAFYHDGNTSSWISAGAFSSQVLFQGLDGAADLLAARFAPIGLALSGGEFLLNIEGVDSLEDYARVQRYLSELQPVQSIKTDRVAPGEIRFRVGLEGDYRLLQQVIGLSNQLQSIAEEAKLQPQNVSTLPALRYRLVK